MYTTLEELIKGQEQTIHEYEKRLSQNAVETKELKETIASMQGEILRLTRDNQRLRATAVCGNATLQTKVSDLEKDLVNVMATCYDILTGKKSIRLIERGA